MFLIPLEPSHGIILDCVRDRGYIGKEEMRAFVWLRISGFPQCVWEELHSYRYAIPLERLQFLWKLTNHDIRRLRDQNDMYQPFLGQMETQPETGNVCSNSLVVEPIGIIYDRELKVFI